MLATIPFTIGFFIYVIFNLLTIDYYSKIKVETKAQIIFFIYLYYTILAIYVINFTDSDGTFIVKLIECIIISVAGGVVILHYARNIVLIREEKNKYEY